MAEPALPFVSKPVARRLAKVYAHGGYVRTQNKQRVKAEGHSRYKKGDEVRLLTATDKELAEVRALLEEAGFTPGRPFVKGAKHCQPIYGKAAVARFLDLVSQVSDA